MPGMPGRAVLPQDRMGNGGFVRETPLTQDNIVGGPFFLTSSEALRFMSMPSRPCFSVRLG